MRNATNQTNQTNEIHLRIGPGEKLITLGKAVKYLPKVNGKKPAISTLWRWCRKRLRISPAIFPYDDWEIFIANQRALPSRQYAISPTAKIASLSHGEVNTQLILPWIAQHNDSLAKT